MIDLKTPAQVIEALANPNLKVRLPITLFSETVRSLHMSLSVASELPPADLFREFAHVSAIADRLINSETTEVVGGSEYVRADRLRRVDTVRFMASSAAAFEVVARRALTPEQIGEIQKARGQY